MRLKKKSHNNKSLAVESTADFHQIFKEDWMQIILKHLYKVEGKNTLSNVSINLITNLSSDIAKKENPRLNSLKNMSKILSTILANWIQNNVKKIIHHYQIWLITKMQCEWSTCSMINAMWYINKHKDRNDPVIFIETEKTFTKFYVFPL